jgi:hypothetical protein
VTIIYLPRILIIVIIWFIFIYIYSYVEGCHMCIDIYNIFI